MTYVNTYDRLTDLPTYRLTDLPTYRLEPTRKSTMYIHMTDLMTHRLTELNRPDDPLCTYI